MAEAAWGVEGAGAARPYQHTGPPVAVGHAQNALAPGPALRPDADGGAAAVGTETPREKKKKP